MADWMDSFYQVARDVAYFEGGSMEYPPTAVKGKVIPVLKLSTTS